MSCPVASTPVDLSGSPEEFSARYWLPDQNWRDPSGRFLTEGRHPEAFSGDLDLVVCPYPDSRQNHELPMNASALRAVAHDWTAVLGGVRHLRALLPDGRGTSLSSRDALWVTAAGACLPAYEWRASGSPCSWTVPDATASLYKVCVGAVAALMAMDMGRWADGQQDSCSVTSVQLHAFIDANELLVGGKEVCAGSPAMVRTFLEALLDPVSPLQANRGRVAGIERHGLALLRYAVGLQKLEWAKRGFTFCHHMLVRRAFRQPSLTGALVAWGERRDAWLAAQDPHAAQLEAFCSALGTPSQMRVMRGIERRIQASGAMPALPSYPDAVSTQALRMACGDLRTWLWRQVDATPVSFPGSSALPRTDARESRDALSLVLGPLLEDALSN